MPANHLGARRQHDKAEQIQFLQNVHFPERQQNHAVTQGMVCVKMQSFTISHNTHFQMKCKITLYYSRLYWKGISFCLVPSRIFLLVLSMLQICSNRNHQELLVPQVQGISCRLLLLSRNAWKYLHLVYSVLWSQEALLYRILKKSTGFRMHFLFQ